MEILFKYMRENVDNEIRIGDNDQGSRLRRPPMEQDVKLTPLDVKIFESQVPWDVEIQMSKDALFECR